MQTDLTVSLIGLPNVGKSLIFSVLTGHQSEVSPLPVSTKKPLRAVVSYEDPRMSRIASVIEPKELFPLKIQFIDTGGILPKDRQVFGEDSAETKEHARSSDVLIHIVRAFDQADVPHIDSHVDVFRDFSMLIHELCTWDLALVDHRIVTIQKEIQGRQRYELQAEFDLLTKAKRLLEAGQPLYEANWERNSYTKFRALSLVSHIPHLLAVNCGEEEIESYFLQGKELPSDNAIITCAQLESEIVQLDEDERREFLEAYNGLTLKISEIPKLVLTAANRVTYFTFGHLGLKQWSIPNGTNAVEAARRLHTDFAKNLINVEVFATEELILADSVDKIKQQGKVRVESKEYQVQDGDIMYFRFGK
ncbi:redox-regulated ATPase YchF [bacterium]|nr:redox-regulated ATPase YchF [bacterium]